MSKRQKQRWGDILYVVGRTSPPVPNIHEGNGKTNNVEPSKLNDGSRTSPEQVPGIIKDRSQVVASHRLRILGNKLSYWIYDLQKYNDPEMRRAEMCTLSNRLLSILSQPPARELEAGEDTMLLSAEGIVMYAEEPNELDGTDGKHGRVCLIELCHWIETVRKEKDCIVSASLATLEKAIADALGYSINVNRTSEGTDDD